MLPGALLGCGSARAVRARSQRAGLAEPSEHRDHPRVREEPTASAPWCMELVEGGRSPSASRGPLPLDEALADRAPDRGSARGGARAGHRPSRSEAREHQGRDDGTVKVLDFGLAKAMEPAARCAGDCRSSPTSRRRRRRDGGDPRDGRLHEPRAGARQAGRQAHRHLGVRVRALRDAHRPCPFTRSTTSDTARGDSRLGARMGTPTGRNASDDSATAAALSLKRYEAPTP